MRALAYLLIRTIKNKILSLKKKPAYLILYIVLAVYFIFLFFLLGKSDIEIEEVKSFADIRLLYSILVGFVALVSYSSVSSGLSKGSTLFNMADVGILFPSPIRSIKILFYGLIKQMGTTLVASIFILFQLGNVKVNFDIDNKGIFFLFVIYFAILLYTHLLSMAIYVYSNTKKKRKDMVKILAIFLGILILAAIAFQWMSGVRGVINLLYKTVENRLFQFIPIVGWSVMLFDSFLQGNLLYLIISSLLFIISAAGMIYMFTAESGDYYEDVLVSTEFYHTLLQSAKEGKTVNQSRKKVNDSKRSIGFQGGKGVSTLFYKELLISKRTSRIPFVDTFTIISSLSAGVFCYFMKESFNVYIVLGVLVYIQFFITVMGPLAKELRRPYIYLIPGKSLSKLLYSSAINIVKPAIDGIIIFTIVSIVSKTSPLINLFLALAYISSAAIFISYTVLLQRIFGLQPNKIIQGIVGVILFMFIMTPGITLSFLAVNALPTYLIFLGTLPFTLSCIIISFLIFIICGDLIDKTEMMA